MNRWLLVASLAAVLACAPLALAQTNPPTEPTNPPTGDDTPPTTPTNPNNPDPGTFQGSTLMWLVVGLVVLALVIGLIFALAGGRDRTERVERVYERDRTVPPPP